MVTQRTVHDRLPLRAPRRPAAMILGGTLLVGLMGGFAIAAAPERVSEGTAWDDPTIDALTRQLGTVFGTHDAAREEDLLRSIRSLRDPALKPLFARMAMSDRPRLRLHGVLGLAELDAEPSLDILLVKVIPDAHEQADILTEALRLGLLKPDQIKDLVRWPDLDATLQALLITELRSGGSVSGGHTGLDSEALRSLAGGKTLAAALYASLQLLQRGEPQNVDGLLKQVGTLVPPGDSLGFAAVLDYIRAQRLTAAQGLVRRVLDEHGGDPLVRHKALWTLLVLDPANPETASAWARAYKSAELGERVRLGLAALDAAAVRGGEVAPTVFDTMCADASRFLALMGEAGRAVEPIMRMVENGADESPKDRLPTDSLGPVLELVAAGHAPTVAWALRLAEECPAGAAGEIGLAVIGAAGERGGSTPVLYSYATDAAAALTDANPALLNAPLVSAVGRNDLRVAEAILVGALRSTNPGAGALADAADWPRGDLAALAALVRARHSGGVGGEELQDLAAVALGRGMLPEAFRLQAAWLAIKNSGRQQTAIARVLAEAPE